MDDPKPRGKRGPNRTAPRDSRGFVVPTNKRSGAGPPQTYDSFEVSEQNLPRDQDAPVEGLPPKRINNKYNPRYFSALLGFLNDANARSIANGEGGLSNYKSTLDGILAEAQFAGLDKESVVDNRPESVILKELARRFQDTDASLLEFKDDELNALEKNQSEATWALQADLDAMAQQVHSREHADITAEEREKRRLLELGKRWLERVKQVRKIKSNARNPLPSHWSQTVGLTKHAQKAAHILRFMLYTMRTNISHLQQKGGAEALMQIAPHHRRMAIALYQAKNDLRMGPYGLQDARRHFNGLIQIVPPGHGKTSLATAFWALEINGNPYFKLKIGHAVDEKAALNCKYLSSFYLNEDPTGRRNRALFENIPAVAESSSVKLVFRTPEKSRSASITANGASARVGGDDCDGIWFDDFVNDTERDSELERESKKGKLVKWMDRMRGLKTFHYTTATAWHEDDANMSRVKMAREGKLSVVVQVLSCGGPNGFPPFRSLWPEMFPSSRLRQLYVSDPLLYSATYMSNPRAEELQVIKRLRYYDPASPMHASFINSAVHYLSVDPAATARENSDKASVVYAAVGDVVDNGKSERRLRIIEPRQITANLDGAKQEIYSYSLNRKVDYVAVEEQTYTHALIDALENELDITVIRCPTHSKSKLQRLKAVAVLLEDTRASDHAGGAVVEFPGIRNAKGELVPDPNYEWVERQFLRFGATKDDHTVDAITQLAAYLSRTGELQAGAGFLTDKVREVAETSGDSRILKALEAAMDKRDEKRNVETEDWNFLAGLHDN